MTLNVRLHADGYLTFEDIKTPRETYSPGSTLMIPTEGPWSGSIYAVIDVHETENPMMVMYRAYPVDTFDQARHVADLLWDKAEKASKVLEKYPRGPMGMTPDHIKATFQWRLDKAGSDAAIENMRTFNKWYIKYYKRQIYAYRQAQRERKLQK
jgi:hypothetical protein